MIGYLAFKLCEPVGGVLTDPVNGTGPANNLTTGSSPPVEFTGEARALHGSFVGCMMTLLAFAVVLVVL